MHILVYVCQVPDKKIVEWGIVNHEIQLNDAIVHIYVCINNLHTHAFSLTTHFSNIDTFFLNYSIHIIILYQCVLGRYELTSHHDKGSNSKDINIKQASESNSHRWAFTFLCFELPM